MNSVPYYQYISNKLGTIVNEFPLDGNHFRFNGPNETNNSCWAIGSEWEFKKETYQIVNFGNWKTGERHTWKSFDDRPKSSSFKKQEKEHRDFLVEKTQKEREKKTFKLQRKMGTNI